MSSAIQVPQGISYVGAALLSTVFLLAGQTSLVSRSRREAGIKYPQVYADKEEAEKDHKARVFNCAQRAHQNTLEYIPMIYVTTILGGLKYPVIAAASCALWVVGRISYTRGYITGDPRNRVTALYRVSNLGLLGLLLSSTATVVQSVMAGV